LIDVQIAHHEVPLRRLLIAGDMSCSLSHPYCASDARIGTQYATSRPSDHHHEKEERACVAENLLQRDFSASHPNRKWLTDTTCIWTAEG
jgi:transposase InsO family protein